MNKMKMMLYDLIWNRKTVDACRNRFGERRTPPSLVVVFLLSLPTDPADREPRRINFLSLYEFHAYELFELLMPTAKRHANLLRLCVIWLGTN